MSNAEDMFDGVIALARVIAERKQAERVAKRAARNARRRELYARAPKRPRVKPPVDVEPDYDEPTECFCNATPRPPCGWCENGDHS